MKRQNPDQTLTPPNPLSLLKQMSNLPRNALVLLRGDHITNVMRYLQTCAGVRPDLHLMNDQLVKAKWFLKQEDKYPGIIFPKRRYILDEIFGFSLEELVASNIRNRPIVACDRFQTVHVQQTFKGIPWGLCERVVGTNFNNFDEWWYVQIFYFNFLNFSYYSAIIYHYVQYVQ